MTLRSALWISTFLSAPFVATAAAAESGVDIAAETASAIEVSATSVPLTARTAHSPEASATSTLVSSEALAAIRVAPIAPKDNETTEAFDLNAASLTNASAPAAALVAGVQYGGTAAETEKRDESFTVLLSQDSFFGFYPSFNGLIPIGDNIDFSFYGILWTTDAFGTAAGSDLWTEFGVGVNFIAADGNLNIKPQIGLTNGALLSGGVRDDVTDLPTGTGGNFADGIVPSLTVNYSDDSFEAEYYGGYYAALRNRNDPGANDFLHTWINGGAKITENFSAGAHYELLSLTRSQGGSSAVVYQWLGPYVQFSTDNGFFARFTAGADIESGNDGDFYKLTAGFSF